jgi:hypothetical protein
MTNSMSDNLLDLKSLIEFASKNADKIFRQTGVIYPMYHAIKVSGETTILTPPDTDDKDIAVGMVKAWFALNDIDRYVFIDEAWIVDTSKGGPPLDLKKASARACAIIRTGARSSCSPPRTGRARC